MKVAVIFYHHTAFSQEHAISSTQSMYKCRSIGKSKETNATECKHHAQKVVYLNLTLGNEYPIADSGKHNQGIIDKTTATSQEGKQMTTYIVPASFLLNTE